MEGHSSWGNRLDTSQHESCRVYVCVKSLCNQRRALKELHEISKIKRLKMENRNSLAWYGFQIKYCRGHSIRCRTKKSSNSVCRKPHQSLSCHCIPISTLPHVVSAAFWPWKMEQTGVHQWLDSIPPLIIISNTCTSSISIDSFTCPSVD